MEAEGAIKPGQLLISADPGRGGYFEQSVVLLLEHNENGTLGVCLNRLSGVDIEGPLGHFTEVLTPLAMPFEGGPVSQQSAIALAHVANSWEEPPGWRRVFGDIGMLDLDTPIELVRGAFTHLRIFVGLSGWSPGQLEGELIRGSWFRTAATVEEVFGVPEGMWRRVLRRRGGMLGRWSTWTDQPTLN